MDLVDILRKKINVLKDGEYMPGLKAVLLHIETAFRHLSRGQDSEDDTAFTDAIYRTNQAFEGSIKEAYRVLAGQNPEEKSLFNIEKYLGQNKIFRSRVQQQLTTYRTEWRNPSTHEYKLDFDENEAFLAIVSVSAFSCLLLDQIAERLAFEESQAEAKAHTAGVATLPTASSLMARVTQLLTEFCSIHLPSATSAGRLTEAQAVGALHGFLSSAAPALRVETNKSLGPNGMFRADFLITEGKESLVVELKRGSPRQSYTNAIAQVTHYVLIGSIGSGILLFLPDTPSQMERLDTTINGIGRPLVIMAPVGSHLTRNR
jgi:hypothetical protein